MDEKKKLKMAIISGASHALEYKNKNISATDEEAIRHVTKKANEILNKIEVE